jgi:hypothetical protein
LQQKAAVQGGKINKRGKKKAREVKESKRKHSQFPSLNCTLKT